MVVYTHTRLDSNIIFYIGIGRYEKRSHSKKNRNNYWYNIVNKTGYSVQIVHECETWDEACYTEKYLIAYYGRNDLGLGCLCNMTNGGDGSLGVIQSYESRIKKSISNKGKKLSEETKAKMRENKNRIKHPHSEETIAKIRASKQNISVESREKMRLSAINRKRQPHSEETRIKMRGQKRSEETKPKMRLSKQNISDETRAKLSMVKKGKKRGKYRIKSL